jgi:hypothetical protein
VTGRDERFAEAGQQVPQPGARLQHACLPGGSSLYDRLGAGFTLLGPAGEQDPGMRPDTIGGDGVSSAESGSPGAAGLSMFH